MHTRLVSPHKKIMQYAPRAGLHGPQINQLQTKKSHCSSSKKTNPFAPLNLSLCRCDCTGVLGYYEVSGSSDKSTNGTYCEIIQGGYRVAFFATNRLFTGALLCLGDKKVSSTTCTSFATWLSRSPRASVDLHRLHRICTQAHSL